MEYPNLQYLEEIADGQPKVVAQFLKILEDEFPGERQQYENLIEKKAGVQAAAMVHKLKHKISILGMVQGRDLAVEHEEALKKGNFAHANSFKKLLNLINEFIISNTVK